MQLLVQASRCHKCTVKCVCSVLQDPEAGANSLCWPPCAWTWPMPKRFSWPSKGIMEHYTKTLCKGGMGWRADELTQGGRQRQDPALGQILISIHSLGGPYLGTWSCATNFGSAVLSSSIEAAVCYLGEGECFPLSPGNMSPASRTWAGMSAHLFQPRVWIVLPGCKSVNIDLGVNSYSMNNHA